MVYIPTTEQAEAFTVLFMEGLTYPEMSAQLNVPQYKLLEWRDVLDLPKRTAMSVKDDEVIECVEWKLPRMFENVTREEARAIAAGAPKSGPVPKRRGYQGRSLVGNSSAMCAV